MFDNLTDEQKKNMKASLGVFMMTITVGFWAPLTYLLLSSGMELIYISFIMMAYSAGATYLSKFAMIILGSAKEDLPTVPTTVTLTEDE